ncbi:hypothetical protein [Silvimonas amylolytica]|uniref:hypothetical protein n=1 Tax=Silvimonas amylolytica TaxID=449663 RepID=UPI001667C879|nr:hypothetical protein [Silvimonas amylolytica]
MSWFIEHLLPGGGDGGVSRSNEVEARVCSFVMLNKVKQVPRQGGEQTMDQTTLANLQSLMIRQYVDVLRWLFDLCPEWEMGGFRASNLSNNLLNNQLNVAVIPRM